MYKLISRTMSLAMVIVMTGSMSVLAADITTDPNVATPPVTTPVTPPVTTPVTPVVTPPVTPVVTPPVTPVVTPVVTPPVTPETTQNTGKILVPKQLESKAQPSLFTVPPKPEVVKPEVAKPEVVKPPIAVDQYDFDIASYTTKYTGAESLNRNYNMRLASDSVNGVILQPGQIFSFNDIILAKSDNGKKYKEAGVFVNGELSTGIGGGICQISSTIYQAGLYSGMEIIRRQNHSLRVGYMAAGRDATASWGSIDFKFKNPLDIPVKIESVMKNGTLKIRFLATKDPNVGAITVNVTQKDGVYTLTRTRANGTIDHTSRSKYKD